MPDDIVEQLRERAKRYERNGEPAPHCRDARLDERAASKIEALRAECDRLKMSLHLNLKAVADLTELVAQEARRG